MPIKQIQLRGISRTPSDRSTADGGCAESLNVHLDMKETAPTMPPEDISSSIYGSAASTYQIVFVHKMPGVVNYIGLGSDAYGRYFAAYRGGDVTINNGPTVPLSENFVSCTSVGKTLIAYTDKKPYYFLYKDNEYTFLGNEIPRPSVEVVSKNDGQKTYWMNPVGDLHEGPANANEWNEATEVDNENHEALVETINNMWDDVTKTVAKLRSDGMFSAPFFLRYAVKLYNDSYIYASTPILCGGGVASDWVTAKIYSLDAESNTELRYYLNDAFFVYLRSTYDASGWGDIVRSLDFFVSEPIYAPKFNAEFIGIPDSTTNWMVFDGMDSQNRDKTIKDEVLARGQFYKAASINLDEKVDDNAQNSSVSPRNLLRQGYYRLNASEDVSGDKLATHDNMPFDYRSGSQYLPLEGCQNYNNRVLLMGASELLGYGDTTLNGQAATSSVADPTLNMYTYVLRYKIVDPSNGEVHYVLARNREGGTRLYPSGVTTTRNFLYYGNSVPTGVGPYFQALPYSWLCFPDTRCTEVEVHFYPPGSSTPDEVRVVPLSPHPMLECAYAFLGLGTSLMNLRYNPSYESILVPSTTEDRYISQENKIFLSDFENPFTYPAENIVTFPDKVIGAAVTSVPLSEGQFGDFTMYAFTEGGIRVLGVNSVGTFSANMVHPNLSRHVALRGTICSLEQMVIFITEKGVMLLSGNQVTEISESVNGRPYVLDQSVRDMIPAAHPLYSKLSVCTDTTPFMDFMTNAKVAYDHTHARLLFFGAGKAYQYIYMMETQTWHKLYTGMTSVIILNSYPDCLVSWLPGAALVKKFSTVPSGEALQSLTANKVDGLIATRPFDLDEPDIRKAIRSLRIRGFYNRGDVKYFLLGSFDGINWKLMTSLRGGSYKMFRLVLLTSLSPAERISWIDVDYEDRMTNRLR